MKLREGGACPGLQGELEGKPRLQEFPRAPDPSPFLCPMSPLFYLHSASSRSMCLVPWKMFLRTGTFTDCSQEKQVQEAGLCLLSPGNLSGQDLEFHTGGAFQTRKTHLGFRRVQ